MERVAIPGPLSEPAAVEGRQETVLRTFQELFLMESVIRPGAMPESGEWPGCSLGTGSRSGQGEDHSGVAG